MLAYKGLNKNYLGCESLSFKNGDIIAVTYYAGFFRYIFSGFCIGKKKNQLNKNFTLYLFRDYAFSIGVVLCLNVYYTNAWYIKILYENEPIFKNVSKPLKRMGYKNLRLKLN